MTDAYGDISLTQSYPPRLRPRRGYGEILYSEGTAATDYAFTGESYDPQTGLVFLRARYYSSGDSRFISRDTWTGNANTPMSYNLWAYGYDNPVRYSDPTGQVPSLAQFIRENENALEWTSEEKTVVDEALWDIAVRYAYSYNKELYRKITADCENTCSYLVWKISPYQAFITIHGGPVAFRRMSSTRDYWGEGISSNEVYLYKNAKIQDTRFIVHEMGHVFENIMVLKSVFAAKLGRSNLPESLIYRAVGDENNGGFAGGYLDWQWSRLDGPMRQEGDKWVDGRGEIFADQFVGWVYSRWEIDPKTGELSKTAKLRSDYMETNMPNWIFQMISKRGYLPGAL
jgi:RHS repeat-associated protein